jgi:hypothetical protein
MEKEIFKPHSPQKPKEPKRKDFRIIKHDKTLYTDFIPFNNYKNDIYLSDYLSDNRISWVKPEKDITQMSVKDILDLAPKKADPADVYLEVIERTSIFHIEMSWKYIERDFDEEERQYKKAHKKYLKELEEFDVAMHEYKKKHNEYEKYLITLQIKELQKKLERLK